MRHVTVQQLSAFIDGALAGVSRELVTRHLAACADCRERHALWHIYDEVLQRVLSWEPNERTMEEASARVELTLTAERRGLPPPEFTSVLQPVIASTPDPAASARASALFPTLPPIASPPAAAAPPPRAPAPPPPPMPAPVASAPQPPPPPPVASVPTYSPPPPVVNAPVYSAPPPPPIPPSPVSSALSYPLDPYGSVAPDPASQGAPPPPRAHNPYLPPPPPPGHAAPISVYEDLRARAEAPGPQWASVPLPGRKKRRHRLLALCGILLALVIIATPWMPDVIRIRMPESWEPRVPRVEFVRHGNGAEPPANASAALDPRLSERTNSEPPQVPYRELPAVGDSVTASPAAIDTPAAAPAPPPVERVTAPPPPVAAATPAPARKPKPKPVRPAPPPPAEEEETGTAGAEHSMTFIPVQTKTEVILTPTRSSSAPPPPAADTVGDASLPLLCGEVLDESGAPIEGARIRLTSPPLTIRTDKRGRFCVACPAGERTFLVDAEGFTPVTRGVELSGATFETHITLSAAH